MELAAKTFNAADQIWFANLSGDANPLHLDAILARRTQFGAPIVHGIHGVLWILEAFSQLDWRSLKRLRASFPGPIYVGDTAVAAVTRRTDREIRLEISVRGVTATTVVLELGDEEQPAEALNEAPVQDAKWPTAPLELQFSDLHRQSGAFHFAHPTQAATLAFPILAERILPERVSAIIALSRLVGMICPGLYSVFHSISIDFTQDAERNVLRYATSTIDDRFRLARVAVSGARIAGDVAAFSTLPPIAQPTMGAIALVVPSNVYSGAVVLVVGGSRGLGEVTAKACAAGGAKVIVTYSSGKADAQRVAEEIRAFGGACDLMPLDVRKDIRKQLAELGTVPTHIYYFATGPIAIRRTQFVSAEILEEFMRCYATGFVELCEALHTRARGDLLRVFYPSSIAVAETPKGWTEYAMAKVAGELLCREINKYIPDLSVVMRRLPRVLTDQTITPLPIKAAPALDVMLPIIQELQLENVGKSVNR